MKNNLSSTQIDDSQGSACAFVRTVIVVLFFEPGRGFRFRTGRAQQRRQPHRSYQQLAGYILQWTSVLEPTGWEDIGSITDNGFNTRITIPIPITGNRFFRLRMP
jgi:hypothetical protein